MFNWLKKIRTRKLIKLVVLNNSVLEIIMDMQKIGFEQNLKPIHGNDFKDSDEFIKWLKNRFVINHAILLKFKRDGDIKDKSSVDFILRLDKELRNWYRKSSISIFQSYDDRYNKPLRGWDDICENFFDELPN